MSLVERLKKSPVLDPIFQARYARWFGTSAAFRNYSGVYGSFAEASRSAPQTMPVGCDQPEYADHHVDRIGHIHAYDYPVLFWLRPLLATVSRVFDFGGNVGVHWYSYRPYVDLPAELEWTVCEVPTIVALGRSIAERERADSLRFTDRFADAAGADVFLAAGALHYVDGPTIGQRLAALRERPKHLLLNKVPLGEGETFWTIQNARSTFLPCAIFNRGQFLDDIESAGYEIVDKWPVPTYSCTIPFHPERYVEAMTGLYARLKG
jgi:putative methyltransferase (TIGR04325 family)